MDLLGPLAQGRVWVPIKQSYKRSTSKYRNQHAELHLSFLRRHVFPACPWAYLLSSACCLAYHEGADGAPQPANQRVEGKDACVGGAYEQEAVLVSKGGPDWCWAQHPSRVPSRKRAGCMDP